MQKLLIVSIIWGIFVAHPLQANSFHEFQSPPFQEVKQEWVDSVMDSMTLEEKIGQLIMIPTESQKSREHVQTVREKIKQYHPGGIIFFQGGPERHIRHLNQYQSVTDVPLLISMDAEWGLSMRLDSTLRYPYQMTLGAIQNNHLLYQMGKDIGRQLKRIGVHMNFAPVADINNNPLNPVINYRSFGENRKNVSKKALAYMQGLQDQHILATAKHFPGHGDTRFDSHKTLPVIRHSQQHLDSTELYPFEFLIRQGVSAMMTAHLHVPALDSSKNRPVSLSKPVVEGLLQEEMGFNGLTVTDALTMKGVTKYFADEEIALEALEAGNDILLMPPDIETAIQSIKEAVRNQRIHRERIEHSCRKILSAKFWCKVSQQKSISPKNLHKDLQRPRSEYLIRKLYESALTVVKNTDSVLPVQRLDTVNLASVAIGTDSINTFQQTMNLYANVSHYHINKNSPGEAYQKLQNKLREYDMVIIGVHNTRQDASANYGISQNAVTFATELAKEQKVILDIFANPYSLDYFDTPEVFEGIVVSYEDKPIVQNLSAQLIFGGIAANGRLPVTANPEFPVGTGVQTEKNRLKYAVPEEVNMDRDTLKQIDSIVQQAIRKKATPGCQVLASRDGVVFYHKAFGTHTYLKEQPVRLSDIYDLASITKITGTLPALMHLYEQDQFDLTDRLSTHLSFLDTTNKKDMIIQNILTHQAGLVPWIPFYTHTFQKLESEENLFHNKLTPNYPFKLGSHKFLNKNYRLKKGIFRYDSSKNYSVQVADHFYIKSTYKDTIYKQINTSELSKKKEYVYSDLGFYYFFRMIEQLTEQPLEEYIDSFLCRPLGAATLTYHPLKQFKKSRIVPTQNDKIFRNQLLHGHVHDPGAAMLGGVSGHAGMFSNANDLAKVMQMYLNKGTYGGHRFFDKKTLSLFTSSPFKDTTTNRRALGFDKPVLEAGEPGPSSKSVSEQSFGHSGFTGTLTWADPQKDIVYVFLSNRIHPDQYNKKLISMDIRTRIHDVIYDAIQETISLPANK